MYGKIEYNAETNKLVGSDKFQPFQTGYDAINGVFRPEKDWEERNKRPKVNHNPLGALIESLQKDGMQLKFFVKKYTKIQYIPKVMIRHLPDAEKPLLIVMPSSTETVAPSEEGGELMILDSRQTYAEEGNILIKRRGVKFDDPWVDDFFRIDDLIRIEGKVVVNSLGNLKHTSSVVVERAADSWNDELTLTVSTLLPSLLGKYIRYRINDEYGTSFDKENAGNNYIAVKAAQEFVSTNLFSFPIHNNEQVVHIHDDGTAAALLAEYKGCKKIEMRNSIQHTPCLAFLSIDEYSNERRLRIDAERL